MSPGAFQTLQRHLDNSDRSWTNLYAVQIRLSRMTLIQILRLIGLKEPKTLESILFEGGRQKLSMTSFAIVTLIF